jgi:mannitol-specific phosphotransferase system IIBC component
MKPAWGRIVAVTIAVMAAIPMLMGVMIFAPVYSPLAVLCAWLETSGRERG